MWFRVLTCWYLVLWIAGLVWFRVLTPSIVNTRVSMFKGVDTQYCEYLGWCVSGYWQPVLWMPGLMCFRVLTCWYPVLWIPGLVCFRVLTCWYPPRGSRHWVQSWPDPNTSLCASQTLTKKKKGNSGRFLVCSSFWKQLATSVSSNFNPFPPKAVVLLAQFVCKNNLRLNKRLTWPGRVTLRA